MMQIQEKAERYLTLGMKAAKLMFRLAATVALAMLLQVCVLVFIAFTLAKNNKAAAAGPF